MPFLEGQPKKVSQRHYFSNVKNKAVTSVTNTITTAVSSANDYLAEVRRTIVNHIRNWITASINVEKAKLRCFKAYTEQQVWSIPDNIYTLIPFNQVKLQGNMYDTKTYQYRIAEPGSYLFGVFFRHKQVTGDAFNVIEIAIFKNGIREDTIIHFTESSTGYGNHGATIVDCSCGDLIDARIRMDTAAGVQTTVNDLQNSYFYGAYQGCNYYNTGYQTPTFNQ